MDIIAIYIHVEYCKAELLKVKYNRHNEQEYIVNLEIVYNTIDV